MDGGVADVWRPIVWPTPYNKRWYKDPRTQTHLIHCARSRQKRGAHYGIDACAHIVRLETVARRCSWQCARTTIYVWIVRVCAGWDVFKKKMVRWIVFLMAQYACDPRVVWAENTIRTVRESRESIYVHAIEINPRMWWVYKSWVKCELMSASVCWVKIARPAFARDYTREIIVFRWFGVSALPTTTRRSTNTRSKSRPSSQRTIYIEDCSN